jgi:hypothetical protein
MPGVVKQFFTAWGPSSAVDASPPHHVQEACEIRPTILLLLLCLTGSSWARGNPRTVHDLWAPQFDPTRSLSLGLGSVAAYRQCSGTRSSLTSHLTLAFGDGLARRNVVTPTFYHLA